MSLLRRIFGHLIALAGVLGATGGTFYFISLHSIEEMRRPLGAPSDKDVLQALGAAMELEARRARKTGGPLGAELAYEPPARLTAELVDARWVREIRVVELLSCAPAGSTGYDCSYIARGVAECGGDGCAVFGGAGAQVFEDKGRAVFISTERGWRARPTE